MEIIRFSFYFLICSIIIITTLPTQSQTLYWQSITSDIYVYDILYDGEQNLYFTGNAAGNYFYRSTDLGAIWTRLGSGSLRLYRIAIDSTDVLWGGNDVDGGIYKSTDQGDNWTLSLASNDKIFSITVSPNNWIWAGTYDGKVVYSSDGGNSWLENSFANDIIWSIASNNLNNVFAGSGDGEIYRTTNLGADWELVYDATIPFSIRGIVIDDSNHIYANKYSSRIISTNNGNNWSEISGPSLVSLYMDKYHNFYADPGYRSLDNCLSWSYISPNYPSAFAFIDSLIFAATNDGVFLYDPSYQPYIGENYFPLALGNNWQFNQSCNGNTMNNSIYYINRDTIISGERYFLLEGEVNDWVRYDQNNDKFLLRWNNTDYIVMDYTLNEGSTVQHILFNTHEIKNATIVEPIFISIFDSVYYSKGNFWVNVGSTDWASYLTYYSENLGETKLESHFSGPGGSEGDCLRKMIRAILFDSTGVNYYSDHVKPIINFQPVLTTNNFNLEWNFTVDHDYSSFSTYINVNFIDSVLMFSHYSNGDSTFNNPTTLAVNLPNSINYSLSYVLDSTLMKNEYNFYYKIYAVDKGIIPEYSAKPDTGYYELAYNPTPVSTEINNNTISEYSLKQNYPNPFNPSTTISFSIPERSFVTLKIYDILGREVAELVNEEFETGNFEKTFEAGTISSGVYIYRISAMKDGKILFNESRQMLLIK